MLSNVEHWLVSAAVVIALLAVLFACICGCRKKVPKNELLGLAGMVKITNPEENLEQNYHRENGNSAINDNNRTCVDTAEAHRRAATSTANRSLPDLPVDPERQRLDATDTVWEASEPHSDACSALYATVTENKDAGHLLATAGELAAGALAASDDGKGSDYSSLSQTEDAFAPYAQLKGEHPYDRLRKSEHPYAQVGGASPRPANGGRRPRSSAPAAVGVSNPIAPPRQRKANSFHADAPPDDIAAATAIAGHVSANQELPYMTPPIPAPPSVPTEAQPHFSGDSQDSSKGYTSISVREPLANIKAQSQQRQRRAVGDDVYTTVSDDSEEVYADIEDAQGVYTSGSETYAQILPPPEPAPQPRDDAPPPPSVDSLKHVAQAHSRQASSSSAASSVANLGSPKPEKRQANSPLPPPPPVGHVPDLYATVDKKSTLAPAPVPVERTLDEMYAKVMKRTQRGKDSEDAVSRRLSVDSRSHSTESEPGADESVATVEAPPTDGQSQSSVDSEGRGDDARHPYRPLPESEPPKLSASSYTDPGYEVVQRSSDSSYDETRLSKTGPNYEEVQRPIDPNYEEVHRSIDPNYEEVHRSVDPNYEEVHRSVDPNYEEVHRSVDPNYEEVHRSKDPNYEEVNRSTVPNYEEVQRSRDPSYLTVRLSVDPNYEELRPQVSGQLLSVGSTQDASNEPGYASIGPSDVGYEKVRARSLAGPSYEKVRTRSLAGPTQEKVRAKSLAEPSFEKVRAKSVVEPSYAKINKNRRPKSSVSDEPSYARVYHGDDDGSSVFGSEGDPNYDSVNFARLPDEPPYERLTNSRDSVDDTSPTAIRNSNLTNQRKSSSVETDYEEVSSQLTPDGSEDLEIGRHKLI